MKSELLAKSPMLALPLVALFFFLLVFAFVFIATMRKRAPAYDPLARMPLEHDGDEPLAAGTHTGVAHSSDISLIETASLATTPSLTNGEPS